MAWRDNASDSGRLGNSNSPVRGRALCVEQDFGPNSIAEQTAQGGVNDTDLPVGGPPVARQWTSGSANGPTAAKD